jgi:segregation and condensation protein A
MMTNDFVSSPTAHRVKLPVFEGPLDLLLHLIRKSEVDIFNIPIAAITEEYLGHLELMEALDVNVAGEYLVVAATLIHIKSKMLLPKDEKEEAQEDPRADLVRQLLEYEQFKKISLSFGAMEARRREFYPRPLAEDELVEEEFVEATLFDLLKAFQRMAFYLPQETLKEIAGETFSVTQKMNELLDSLEQDPHYHWRWFGGSRGELIAKLLAVLELVRMKLIQVMQSQRFGEIHVTRAVDDLPDAVEFVGEPQT